MSDNQLMTLAKKYLRALIFLMSVIATCFPYSATAKDKVSLQLRWLHQFQFAGYYMALEKGYYQAAGLDVELIAGGPNHPTPIEQVLSGGADFAVTSSGLIIDRMEGKPVVALAAIMQTSPMVLISLGGSGIRTPQELSGKTVLTMPLPESAEFHIMAKREGIPPENINFQPSTYRIEDLIEGKVDVYDGYISNEPYFLEQRGIDFHLIRPADYGINFYSDVLMTSERLAVESPQIVEQFTQASLQGWRYALANIEETIYLIKRKYAREKSLNHLRFEAQQIRKLVMADLVDVGHMNPGRWHSIANIYRELELTKGKYNIDGFLFRPAEATDVKLAVEVAIGSSL